MRHPCIARSYRYVGDQQSSVSLKGPDHEVFDYPFFYLEHSNYLGYEFKHTSTLLILVSKAEEDKNSNLCRITAGEESQSRIRLQDFKNALPVPYSIIIILIFYPRMLGRSTFSSFPFLISNTSIKKKHFFSSGRESWTGSK